MGTRVKDNVSLLGTRIFSTDIRRAFHVVVFGQVPTRARFMAFMKLKQKFTHRFAAEDLPAIYR
jgi:hypothetical protein